MEQQPACSDEVTHENEPHRFEKVTEIHLDHRLDTVDWTEPNIERGGLPRYSLHAHSTSPMKLMA